jgi:hypothetical protein
MDEVIYQATTGPHCKQCNGGRGDAGIRANADVGGQERCVGVGRNRA